MKRKISIFLFISIGLIFCYEIGLTPFDFHAYKMQIREYGDRNEIQSGALAGYEPLQYRFILQNSDTLKIGNGTRIINLFEEKPLSLGWGSIFPFFRFMNPETIFRCQEDQTKRNLGKIKISKIITAVGFFSRHALKDYLKEEYHQEIIDCLESSRKFIDEDITRPEDRLASAYSNIGDAKVTVKIVLDILGQPTLRRIKFKQGVPYSRDSLLFSSYLDADTLLHHEIIIVDKNKEEMAIERYYNNGQMALQAYFEEQTRFREKYGFFMDKDDTYSYLGGLEESGVWKRWRPNGELIEEIDYSKE